MSDFIRENKNRNDFAYVHSKERSEFTFPYFYHSIENFYLHVVRVKNDWNIYHYYWHLKLSGIDWLCRSEKNRMWVRRNEIRNLRFKFQLSNCVISCVCIIGHTTSSRLFLIFWISCSLPLSRAFSLIEWGKGWPDWKDLASSDWKKTFPCANFSFHTQRSIVQSFCICFVIDLSRRIDDHDR
jgi:hypothetical protein